MRFSLSSLLLIIVAGMCFAMFIIFNYAFNDPATGLFEKLNESAIRVMSSDWLSWFQMRKEHIATGFGLSGVVMMGLAIFLFIADALGDTGSEF